MAKSHTSETLFIFRVRGRPGKFKVLTLYALPPQGTKISVGVECTVVRYICRAALLPIHTSSAGSPLLPLS